MSPRDQTVQSSGSRPPDPAVEERHTPQEKALKSNRDHRKFGTFAEIGAGQEVARWFFHAGKAS
ncbi:MAG TPA: hypothetical protein VJ732_11090, partial [Bryobacteraceae bacterium]|nr:hypothetical protein [Bryobacteraceae bacterium]